MKLKGIEKREPGRYITRYNLLYEMEGGAEKVYEMISRDKNMETKEDLTSRPADAVVLIMTDETGERILLNREFRMAAGVWVYNFPAGLIDPGETPEESAKRELREETGLQILSIEDTIRESYSAVGFSNEKNVCIVGKAGGTFAPSNSAAEEIQAGWHTREEVLRLLETEPFAARTQAYCYLWCRQK